MLSPANAPLPLASLPGYTGFYLRCCSGRNELMGSYSGHTLSSCADACSALDTCVSFEYSALRACQLSSSCLEPFFTSCASDHFRWSVYVKDGPSPPPLWDGCAWLLGTTGAVGETERGARRHECG